MLNQIKQTMKLTIDTSTATVTINGTPFVCPNIAEVIRLADEISSEDNIVFPYTIFQAMLHLNIIDECEDCGDIIEYADRRITGGGFVVCPDCAKWAKDGENDLKHVYEQPK